MEMCFNTTCQNASKKRYSKTTPLKFNTILNFKSNPGTHLPYEGCPQGSSIFLVYLNIICVQDSFHNAVLVRSEFGDNGIRIFGVFGFGH